MAKGASRTPRRFNGALLLKARVDLGLTQEQVADAAGVDVRTYRRYESGEVNDPRAGFSIRSPSRRRILERLCDELGVTEEDLLVEAPLDAIGGAPSEAASRGGALVDLRDQALWAPLHAFTLQRARHFVGREALLDDLTLWAAEERPAARVIAIVALGGAGKTAALERLAASLGDAKGPRGALVWSFYEDARVDRFIAEALAYFDPEAAGAPPGERADRLFAALRRGPRHLLLLDGLEVLQAEGSSAREARAHGARAHGEICDPSLRRLLLAVARGLGASRVIVTSRVELTDLAAWEGSGLLTVRLPSLSESEGASLLSRWGILGGEAALRQLAATTGGHALSVAMIGSYVGSFLGGDAARFDASVPELAARDDALARRLRAVLNAYAGALSREERDLLARICVFPSGVGEGVLLAIAKAGGAVSGSLAGTSSDDIGRSIGRLSRRGLLFSWREGAELRASTHPFLREHFKALLGVSPSLVAAAAEAPITARLHGKPGALTEDRALLDAFEGILRRALEAGRPVEAYSVYSRSMGGFAHLGLRLGDMARGARILRSFAEGDDPTQMASGLPPSGRAALAYEWGLYSGALGDLAFAVRCYEAHNEIALEIGEEASLATGLRTLAYTERLLGRLEVARGHIERSIEIAEGSGAVDQEVRSRALLGAILHDLGDTYGADAVFEGLAALGVSKVARRGLWEAEHDLALGRVERAREVTLHNLSVCSKLGWQGHVAHCHAVLGLVSIRTGALGEAREHLARARRWAGATSEVEMALRCRDLAARIALAAGDRGEAAIEAEAGLSVAEACGFGLYRAWFMALALSL